ncbi:MAG TPA: Ig-like domain-containing protein [Blastocatellia bacterium]|nr:Ig-like domain-containing protein [Blastocatellia bacterium]HMY73741.1 Ig-like domain-containing protein [Blastocatellia bacterium]
MQAVKRIIAASLVFGALGIGALSGKFGNAVHAKISPGPPLGFTGAPGEGTCVGCHYTFNQPNPPNSGGKVEITGLPASYALGQSYTVVVTVSHPTARAWGFELTSLDAGGTSSTVGSLNVITPTTVLKRESDDSGKPRTYLSHNGETGIAQGKTISNSWSFTWTAPANNAGDVTFYAVGNAANNQVSPEDDYIYTVAVKVASPAGGNRAPVFAALPDRVAGVGDRISFNVAATDPDNNPLTITATALANATFDAAAKRFSFTPAANQLGNQQVTFTAGDGQLQTQQTVRFQVLGESSQALTKLSKTSGPSPYLDFSQATAITLTAEGAFGANAAILFNGLPLTSQTVSGGLSATIQGSELSNTGAYVVRVRLGNNTLTNARVLALTSTATPQTATTVEAASYSNTVAPGEIVALFGSELAQGLTVANALPLPRSLQNAALYVNGIAAPLYFVSANQINYQMPYATAPGTAAVVVLREDGIASYGPVNVATAAPALFTADASGKGQAAAQNSDFSRNGDPTVMPQAKRARKGDYVILYGTGCGAQFVNANNNQPLTAKDGEAATGIPLLATATLPTVTIGEKNSTVYFSGLVPGFVSLWQLNVQIPNDAPSGASVEVAVSFGGKTANRVTIAVE